MKYHQVYYLVWSLTVLCQLWTETFAWKSKECPIDSQESRESLLCLRPCDYEEPDSSPSRNQHSRNLADKSDSFFVVFFPPKNGEYEKSRLKCPSGFRQTNENSQCFCERSYTPYELEMQRRERCDQSFEKCRMYGAKPYDCNHIIDACPAVIIRDYCLAGRVFKMRYARVVYEFCHAFLRLPNDGRKHFVGPDIDRLKLKF